MGAEEEKRKSISFDFLLSTEKEWILILAAAIVEGSSDLRENRLIRGDGRRCSTVREGIEASF